MRAAAAALDLERAGGRSAGRPAEPRAGGGAVQAPIVRTTGSTRRRQSGRGPFPVGMLDEFQLDNSTQSRKAVPDGTPDEGFGHVVVLVPVDIAAAHDGAPRQFQMAGARSFVQAAAGFGNDFQASGDGVEGA